MRFLRTTMSGLTSFCTLKKAVYPIRNAFISALVIACIANYCSSKNAWADIVLQPEETRQGNFIAKYGAWYLYEIAGYSCYIVSEPKKSYGNFSLRNKPKMIITYFFAKDMTELIADVGYSYATGKDVVLDITNEKKQVYSFKMQTNGSRSWSFTNKEDDRVISMMTTATEVAVRGRSNDTKYSLDVYGMDGFLKALNTMTYICDDGKK